MKQAIKYLFTIYCLLYTANCLNAQVNLVPNYSFEDTVHCPSNVNELYDSELWINPTTATPDYLNACGTYSTGVSVPHGWAGYQIAHTGVAYTGIFTYTRGAKNYREYIQIKLSDSLLHDIKYMVSFYVSLGNYCQYAVATLGTYLSKTQISSSTDTYMPYTPQVQNNSSNPITDTLNWVLISDTIIAQGGEQYITIGNFMSDSLSDTLKVSEISNSFSLYYIDDVSVIALNSTGISQYSNLNTHFSVYPNPTNSTVTLQGVNPLGMVRVYNTLGQIVFETTTKDKTLPIDFSNQNAGIYFVQAGQNTPIKLVKQ